MVIIPAIDLKDGQCVRLRKGIMEDTTVFSNNPTEMAARWVNEGARRLHLVDLNGAFEGKPINADCVNDITKSFPDLPVQIGGGIRDLKTANAYIEAGISYLIVGTMAVDNPEFVEQLCQEFPNKIIVGLDANNGFVATDGWAKQTDINVAELAKKGDKDRFTFPRPMTDRPGLDFSFSGLKTYARNTFIDFPNEKENIAKAFEVAATETLTIKCKRALKQTGFKTLVVSGGVSANLSLRESLDQMGEENDVSVFYPALNFCTDNGAMIALAGHYRFLAGQSNENYEISIKPRWSLEELLPV